MGCSGFGAGGHGGDVGGLEDEEACGAGACSGGGDVDGYGGGGGLDGLDYGAGGVEESAGGSEGEDDEGCVAFCGFVEAALDVGGGDGLDGVVEGQAEDEGLFGL